MQLNSQTQLTRLCSLACTHIHKQACTHMRAHTHTHTHTQDSGIPISNQCSPAKQTQQTRECRNGEGVVCLYWANIESEKQVIKHTQSHSFVHWHLKLKLSDISVSASNSSFPTVSEKSCENALKKILSHPKFQHFSITNVYNYPPSNKRNLPLFF